MSCLRYVRLRTVLVTEVPYVVLSLGMPEEGFLWCTIRDVPTSYSPLMYAGSVLWRGKRRAGADDHRAIEQVDDPLEYMETSLNVQNVVSISMRSWNNRQMA